jgi:CHAD domain-containing protein
VKAGGDEELVHDLRVALRRAEALARLFRGVPEKGDGEPFRASARELRRRLTVLRSEEVGRALLESRAEAFASLPIGLVFPGELPAVRVDAGEIAAIERAIARWKRKLVSARGGASAQPRAEAQAALLRRTRRRLVRLVRRLSALLPPDGRTLHAARIAAKRLRYALEFVEPLDPGIRPLLRLLRAFQDAAGDFHDLAELAATVGTVAAGDGGNRLALAPLARDLEADAGRALAAARRRGSALERPVRRLRRSLEGLETR